MSCNVSLVLLTGYGVQLQYTRTKGVGDHHRQ